MPGESKDAQSKIYFHVQIGLDTEKEPIPKGNGDQKKIPKEVAKNGHQRRKSISQVSPKGRRLKCFSFFFIKHISQRDCFSYTMTIQKI